MKGRWRRLTFINTYSVSKAIEIANAAFILHNFCYVYGDEWSDPHKERDEEEDDFPQTRTDRLLGERKRNCICEMLNQWYIYQIDMYQIKITINNLRCNKQNSSLRTTILLN